MFPLLCNLLSDLQGSPTARWSQAWSAPPNLSTTSGGRRWTWRAGWRAPGSAGGSRSQNPPAASWWSVASYGSSEGTFLSKASVSVMERWVVQFQAMIVKLTSVKRVETSRPSGSDVFHEQPGRALQLYGAWRWAGLQHEQEHPGSRGLQSGPGQEEGEAAGGERRLPPGRGVLNSDSSSTGQLSTQAEIFQTQRNVEAQASVALPQGSRVLLQMCWNSKPTSRTWCWKTSFLTTYTLIFTVGIKRQGTEIVWMFLMKEL